jgi:DNA adenine methylase
MGLAAESEQVSLAVRPPLKWAGGKRWLVRHIAPLWEPEQHRRLVEPLCGGLAVTLALRPRRALLNDINPHTINFYQWLKKGLRIPKPFDNKDNDAARFYGHRRHFNELVAAGRGNTKPAASLFYYLNRTCYNGLCRFNRKGEFNVPFGRYKNIHYREDFFEYRPLFANWEFQCGDFEQLEVEADDFIYADPPYDVEFTQYAKENFLWQDQERLARWLARHPGPVVISNQATKRIKDLYSDLGFELRPVKGPRLISCTGDRTPVDEVLAMRNCGND